MRQSPALKRFPNLIHACSDKSEGNMSFKWGTVGAVSENRRNFLGALGISLENSVSMSQKHGVEIGFVGESAKGKDAPAVDCLITKSKNLFLLALTADCLPVIFYDSTRGVLGLAHLSRINTPLQFAGKIVERFEKEGSNPESISVSIGPGVRKESYVFDGNALAKMMLADEWKDFLIGMPDGKKSIDLAGYVVRELVSAGVLPEHIEVLGADTITDKNFFSHYRSGFTGEPEGRMATVAGMINKT